MEAGPSDPSSDCFSCSLGSVSYYALGTYCVLGWRDVYQHPKRRAFVPLGCLYSRSTVGFISSYDVFCPGCVYM